MAKPAAVPAPRAGTTPLLARPEFQRVFYPSLVAVLLRRQPPSGGSR